MERARQASAPLYASALVVACAVCAPWLVPASLPGVRIFLGLVAWLTISKTVELARDLPRDPRTYTSTGAFLLWLVMPPAVTWPADAQQRSRFRVQGLRRVLRGLLKGACLLGLIALSVARPAIHQHFFVHSFWGMWVCYLVFSGGMDLGTSLPMMFGIHVGENFDSPFLASSPSDLWGRRWNLWFHDFARREVFTPLRRHLVLAVIATFVVSGLAHEYLVVAALGRSRGYMLAFFLLQALAVLVTRRLGKALGRRPPRLLAQALHLGWLLLTVPLFLKPIFEAVPLDELRAYL